jgi:citrate lyase subunit beta/citryl-CoA lyase
VTGWRPAGPALLFCPADRPDRYAKAYDRADMVILDLEDGVAEGDKPAARAALLAAAGDLDPARTVVRINADDGPGGHRAADLALLDALGAAGAEPAAVMVPKAAGAADVAALAPRPVIALCETAAGVLNAPGIAGAANCAALSWGGEDLIADLGGRSSRGPDGRYRDVVRAARSRVLLSAAASRVTALDAIWTAIHDLDGLAAEAEDGAASGFAGKILIHPGHVAAVRAAFRPTPDQLDWANRVVAAAETSAGAFTVDGRMVDAPAVAHARAIIAAGE